MTSPGDRPAAERVLIFADAWEDENLGPYMYRGYGRTAETADPGERLAVADLRSVALDLARAGQALTEARADAWTEGASWAVGPQLQHFSKHNPFRAALRASQGGQ